MKRAPRKPTFEMLAKKRRLAVVVPETGFRFVISLRDWEQCLWAVRVVPHKPGRAKPSTSMESAQQTPRASNTAHPPCRRPPVSHPRTDGTLCGQAGARGPGQAAAHQGEGHTHQPPLPAA